MARAPFIIFAALALSVLHGFAGLQSFAADSSLQIIDFTSPRCGPCQSMQPAIDKLAREGWKIRQVNVEQETQLIEPFAVKSLPTLVILREGREIDRVVGALGYEKLKGRFHKAAGNLELSAPSQLSFASAAPQAGASPRASTTSANAAADIATVRGQSPSPIAAFPLLSASTGALSNDASELGNAAANHFVSPNGQAPREMTREPAIAYPSSLQPASMQPLLPQTAPTMVSLAAASNASGTSSFSTHAPMAEAASAQPFQGNASLAAAGNSQTASGRATGPVQTSAVVRAQAATVRIRIEEPNSISFGTGTVINLHGDQALVLTCGHLFRDITPAAKLSVDLFGHGQPVNVPAQLVAFNAKESDIGLIEFRSPVAIEAVRVASMPQAPEVGDNAFSFGCDRGADPTRRDTKIKRINRYLGAANVEIHGAPVVGRSGGGLFDAEGRLIGVCNAADEKDDEGIYAALPVVHEQLASLKLDDLGPKASSSPSPVQFASTQIGPTQTHPASMASPANSLVINQSAPVQPAFWPDQQQAAAVTTQASLQRAPSAQVHCVIRDAQGKESAITIDHASEELLAMLRQHAR